MTESTKALPEDVRKKFDTLARSQYPDALSDLMEHEIKTAVMHMEHGYNSRNEEVGILEAHCQKLYDLLQQNYAWGSSTAIQDWEHFVKTENVTELPSTPNL